MASVSMMASFVGGAAIANQPTINTRRTLIMSKTAAGEAEVTMQENGRRSAMIAVAAGVVSAVVGSGAGTAFAVEGLKRRTPEAKKKYAPICVTMPTARVCNKIA